MNEFDELFEQKMKMGFYQYIMLMAACALQFTNGSLQITFSIAAKKLQSEKFLSDNELTLLTSTYQAGIFCGGFIVGVIADKFGRYRILLINCAFGLALFVWTYFMEDYTSILVVNWLYGLFSASHYVVLVTYLFEHMPAKIRGRMTVIFKSFTTIGRTVGSGVASLIMTPYFYGRWKSPIIFNGYLVLTAFIPFLFVLKESLRYSYSSHDYRSLYANFNWILRMNTRFGGKGRDLESLVTADDISVIKTNTLLRQSTLKNEGGLQLYFSRKYIYPNIALTLNRMFMQTCLTGFMILLPQIVGVDSEGLRKTTIATTGEYFGQILCGFLVDTKTFGRKRTIVLANLATSLVFMIAIFDGSKDSSTVSVLFMIVAWLTRMSAKCTLTAIEIYATEAYPVKIRTVAAGVNTFMVGLALVFFPTLFKFLKTIAPWAIYAVLTFNSFVAFALAYFLAKDVPR
jgi:MFS family permease